MHEVVKTGDTLQVGLPRNRFRIPKSTKRAILLVHGIGLTPILSIADYLKSQDIPFKQSQDIPFKLHYVFALMSPGAFESKINDASFAETQTIVPRGKHDHEDAVFHNRAHIAAGHACRG